MFRGAAALPLGWRCRYHGLVLLNPLGGMFPGARMVYQWMLLLGRYWAEPLRGRRVVSPIISSRSWSERVPLTTWRFSPMFFIWDT